MTCQLLVARFLGFFHQRSCFFDDVAGCLDHQSNVRTPVAGAGPCLFLIHFEPAGVFDDLFSNFCDDVIGSDGPVNVQDDVVSG